MKIYGVLKEEVEKVKELRSEIQALGQLITIQYIMDNCSPSSIKVQEFWNEAQELIEQVITLQENYLRYLFSMTKENTKKNNTVKEEKL